MDEDADVIRRAAETLLALGRTVVVLCHSYGGTPTTQGLAGLPVKRIIYLAAIVPRLAQSQLDALGLTDEHLPPTTGGYMHMDAVALAGAIINDVPWEQAYALALQLRHHSRVSFEGKVSRVAYVSVPVTYVVTQKDLIVSPKAQRGFVRVIEEAGGSVGVEVLDSGHCPNWSAPGELVRVIVKSAELERGCRGRGGEGVGNGN